MACSKCKEKKTLKEDLIKSTGIVSKGIVWFTIIWTIFAIYGIYSLITKFI